MFPTETAPVIKSVRSSGMISPKTAEAALHPPLYSRLKENQMVQLCEALQMLGICTQPYCSRSHDLGLWCFDCHRVADSGHINSPVHLDTLAYRRSDTVCPICDVVVSEYTWGEHLQGPIHAQRRLNCAWRGEERLIRKRVRPPGKQASCSVCCMDFVYVEGLSDHLLTGGHQERLLAQHTSRILRGAQWGRQALEMADDKGTIDFGTIETLQGGRGDEKRAENLRFTARVDQLVLVSAAVTPMDGFMAGNGPFYLINSLSTPPCILHPNEIWLLTVVATPYGKTGTVLHHLDLVFQMNNGITFAIRMQLEATFKRQRDRAAVAQARLAGRPLSPQAPILQALVPSMPPPTALPNARSLSTAIVRATPRREYVAAPDFQALSIIPYRRRLVGYPFDPAFEIRGTRRELLQTLMARLPPTLSARTYQQFWATLLQAEEAQMRKDLEMYNLDGVRLEKHGQVFFLDVPGLAEKRPSILMGDIVDLRLVDEPSVWYGGRVVEVRDADIGITVSPRFKYDTGALCDIQFTVNRMLFQRMHHAVTKCDLWNTLFPDVNTVGLAAPLHPSAFAAINPFNPRVATNEHQLKAVTAILRRTGGSAPFVIFGPPGTGKTVTVVEAIRQLVAMNPNATILACAPSNAAADIIAERLQDLGPGRLFRLNAPSRKRSSLPEVLQPFSCVDSNGMFSIASVQALGFYKVIVSTCMSAYVISGMGIRKGHFSHVFIDEAGQCSEPELVVSLTTASNQTVVVLSGDPKQLGPIVRSPLAGEFGLQISLLDRLTENPLYDVNAGDGLTIVKLVKNFRSHESILRFPNESFYQNDLQVCGPPEVINSLVDCPELVTPGFPIIFHGIDSPDQRDNRSPSYFNAGEVSVIAEIVDRLLNDAAHPLNDSRVGIIAPYHAQVMRLQERLRPFYQNLKIGSTEVFQGQERDVILISTVRSDESKLGHDLRHVLGFLVNPRRLNVALTRAKALLVIVGNPRILGLDPLWRRLLTFIHKNGGWKGIQPNWDLHRPDLYNDILQRNYDSATARESMDALTRQLHSAMIRQDIPGDWVADMGRDFDDIMREVEAERPWRVEE